ncbi:MAG: carboxypeptidase-like regulatory domain-containing protein, partial [Candidatus Dojkabacteria bacterium]|nr:carboxypeptidase-like regulatory domain-containing protein [Candidatus Dojkabacteria bacterium]
PIIEPEVEQGNRDNDDNFEQEPGMGDTVSNNIIESIKKFSITEELLRRIILITSTVSVIFMSLGVIFDLPYWRVLTLILPFAKRRDKDRKYVLVYDSVTKSPISGAIARIFDSSNKLVKTSVTDYLGTFEVELQNGNYRIEVFARGYKYPSEIIQGNIDEPHKNVYHGEIFEYSKDKVLEYSIPMDPIEKDFISYTMGILKHRIARTLILLQHILMIILPIFLVIALIKSVNIFNLISLVVYLIILIITIIAWIQNRRVFGSVFNTLGEDLRGFTVVLREVEFDRVVSKRVTDDLGRYRFVVPGGKYRLEILEKGYTISSVDKIEYEGKDGEVMIINPDIEVKKVQ